MRISGLATGMDIEQTVADLMRAERLPVDKLVQQRQIIQWQMEDYREINRKLDAFRNSIFDGVMRQSNMLAKSVSSSNDKLVTATGSSSAGNTSLRIERAKDGSSSVARAATYHSTGKITENGKVNTAGTLRSQSDLDIDWKSGVIHKKEIQQDTTSKEVAFNLKDKLDKKEGEEITENDVKDMFVKVNGKSYKVTTDPQGETYPSSDTVLYKDGKLEFNTAINKGSTVSVTYMTESETETFTATDDRKTFQLKKGGLDESSLKIGDYNVVTDREAFNSSASDNDVYVNLNTGQIEFKTAPKDDVEISYAQQYTTSSVSAFNENGEKISDSFVFTANQSLNQVLTELNRSSVKVNGFYDEFTNKVSVSRTETGIFNENGAEIEFDGFFKDALKLDDEQDSGAANAKFQLNGLETERRSNTFTVSGITVTLKGELEPNEVITLGASTNTDKVFDTIKNFVEEYNELVDLVNGKLKEDRHRDYRPLTDEQKDALSDKEVERWEEKARSGLLKNDSALRTPFNQMRSDVYSAVRGGTETDYNQLATIGITTSKDYMAGGKLELDEDKLRAAIENDAEGVYQLFAAEGDSFEEKGIGRRMRETLDSGISALADRAGGFRGKVTNNQFALGRSLDSINDRISNFERRMQQVEERYWRQFNAMEAAVQKANQQAESLFSQLYGGMQ